MTIRQVEEIAQIAAIAAANEIMEQYIGMIKSRLTVLANAQLKEDHSGGSSGIFSYATSQLQELINQFEESAK
jgi:hypothetical protein